MISKTRLKCTALQLPSEINYSSLATGFYRQIPELESSYATLEYSSTSKRKGKKALFNCFMRMVKHRILTGNLKDHILKEGRS